MVENHAEYQALLALFEQSEAKIKHTERITGEGLVLPSINQLRYSGHHIVRALLNNNDTSEIEKATNHVKRAIYDADEVLLLFYLETIRIFKEKYANYPATIEVLPDYISHCIAADAANDAIQTLYEAKVNYQNRDQVYQQCETHIQTLKTVVRAFEHAVPLIEHKIQTQINIENTQTRRFWMGTLVAILLAAIASILRIF